MYPTRENYCCGAVGYVAFEMGQPAVEADCQGKSNKTTGAKIVAVVNNCGIQPGNKRIMVRCWSGLC